MAEKRGEGRRGARVRDFLAAALVGCERYHDAQAVLQVQLELATRRLGPHSGGVVQATQDLADICFKAKDYERAEKYHREVLQQVEFWRRPDDALTGFARIGLAKIMRGEDAEAERYARRLAAIAPAVERQRAETAAVSERLDALRERDAERFRMLHEEQARRSNR